jgi:hypothetical protein
MPTSFIATPSKIYPNWYFWFENKPSGNPDPESLFREIAAFRSPVAAVPPLIHFSWPGLPDFYW